MTAPARSLAAELRVLRVLREYRVTGLAGGPGHWRLVLDTASASVVAQASFDAVIMAIPAPQIDPLAASAGIRFAELERVRYAPCLTLMLAFDQRIELPEPSFCPSHGPVERISRNASKPGRDHASETVVVHATPDWSRAHYIDSAEAVADALLTSVQPQIGDASPVLRMVHRWLYARVEQAAEIPFLWDPVRQVGACGDWADGPRVECAFDSGEALAAEIIARFA